MISIKKVISIVLVISFIININSSILVYATTNKKVKVVNIEVRKSNVDKVIKEYNVPKEVEIELKKIYKKYPKSKITLSNEDKEDRSSSPSWSSYRTYKKHKIRDWIITKDSTFEMENIESGMEALGVIDIFWIVAGEVVGLFGKGASYSLSIAQAIIGNKTSYSPADGDFLEAAPSFTCKEKFTYVYIGDDYYLGTKSYRAQIKSISWRLYLDSVNRDYQKRRVYNRIITTEHYNRPDEAAINSYSDGGTIDEPPTFNIGKAVFSVY